MFSKLLTEKAFYFVRDFLMNPRRFIAMSGYTEVAHTQQLNINLSFQLGDESNETKKIAWPEQQLALLKRNKLFC